jgi:uncharacterized tellurite resistance protein B-like protein
MWILKWLRLGKAERAQAMPESASFSKLFRVLDGIDAQDHDEAQYLAAFAYLLGRVAFSDGFISAVEIDQMKQILTARSTLNFMQVALVIDIAKFEAVTSKGEDGQDVTALFARITDDAQKREMVDCLYAVAAADEVIHASEEAMVQRISAEVGVDSAVLETVRAAYAQWHKA